MININIDYVQFDDYNNIENPVEHYPYDNIYIIDVKQLMREEKLNRITK